MLSLKGGGGGSVKTVNLLPRGEDPTFVPVRRNLARTILKSKASGRRAPAQTALSPPRRSHQPAPGFTSDRLISKLTAQALHSPQQPAHSVNSPGIRKPTRPGLPDTYLLAPSNHFLLLRVSFPECSSQGRRTNSPVPCLQR